MDDMMGKAGIEPDGSINYEEFVTISPQTMEHCIAHSHTLFLSLCLSLYPLSLSLSLGRYHYIDCSIIILIVNSTKWE